MYDDTGYSDSEEEPSDEACMDFVSDGECTARTHHAQPTRWLLIDAKKLVQVQARQPLPAVSPGLSVLVPSAPDTEGVLFQHPCCFPA